MILYIDTSHLTKIYIEEEDSDAVRAVAMEAAALAASRLGYAEFRAMLARSRRSGRTSQAQFREVRSNFEVDWREMLVIDVTDELVRAAGDLADRYFVRGFDATHLASAVQLRLDTREQVLFSTADGRLRDAAAAEGFAIAP